MAKAEKFTYKKQPTERGLASVGNPTPTRRSNTTRKSSATSRDRTGSPLITCGVSA